MIWSIVSKAEMNGFGTTPVFTTYQEALGRDNIKLAAVDEKDKLGFVLPSDIVLLRTASEKLIDTIRKIGCKTTAENYDTYQLIYDKESIGLYLQPFGIAVPHQYTLSELEEGKTYFVKLRYGSDSKGITPANICHSIREVEAQISRIDAQYGEKCVIEDFLDGKEYTVACAKIGEEIITSPIQVECNTKGGIQTFGGKLHIEEFCSAARHSIGFNLHMIAKKTFKALGLKHHARIDFRSDKKGNLYVIDVNAIPGLGMKAHFAKCFLLSRNYSYIDTLRTIIKTASKL